MLVKKFNNQYFPSVFDVLFNEDNVHKVSKFSNPDYNVFENENDFTVEIAAPGLDKKNFKIAVNEDVLEIQSEFVEQKEEKQKNYIFKGFSYGNFQKNFTLPQNIDKDNIKANYDNGVLQVIVPKKEIVKATKQIEIS
jgi:HSP20 family protein